MRIAALKRKTGAAIARLMGAGVTRGKVLEAACGHKLDGSGKQARSTCDSFDRNRGGRCARRAQIRQRPKDLAAG